MTWETIATDGYVVGTLEFLDNVWRYEPPIYREEEAEIIKVSEQATCFDRYDFDCDNVRGVASLIMRKSFNPIVRQVLGINQFDSLDGVIVQAYYNESRLVGFKKLDK